MSIASKAKRAALRPVRLGQWTTIADRKADGTILMRVKEPLGDYPVTWIDSLEKWAKQTPERVFLAQRGADDAWQKLTYAQVLDRVRQIGAALLTRGLSRERPIVVISGNGIEHALLALGAM